MAEFPRPREDPLGEALHFLRMSGSFYCRSELRAPWGLFLPPMRGCLWFHVVLAGRCTLQVPGSPLVALARGDVGVVPRGGGHRLFADPAAAAPDVTRLPQELVSERYSVLHHGGDGAPSTLICAAVRFERPAAAALIEALPRVLHLERGTEMSQTLRLLAREARKVRPGGEAVITRLADILVIQALRAWLDGEPAGRTSWIGALRDPRIGRALLLIHRDPARAWTVGALARAVGMSRSAFSARFTALAGEPAMQHLARWRIHVAQALLREEHDSLAELAGRVGYGSEAAFGRAFKRITGTSPGGARGATRAR